MRNVYFDGDNIIITNEIRKIISDLSTESDFSGSTTDEYYEYGLPINRHSSYEGYQE